MLPNDLLLVITLYLGSLACVHANTEIVNFGVSRAEDAVVVPSQTSTWSRLGPNSSETLFSVLPAPLNTAPTDVCEPASFAAACPHELWLSLGTDEPGWTAYSRFTLRVSWPASFPTDFLVDVFSPASLARLANTPPMHLTPGEREPLAASSGPSPSFARIRLVDTGVLVPALRRNRTARPVPFIVTVEPLYLGAIPKSVVPTILAIVAVSAVAILFVVPPITAYLSEIADRIRDKHPPKSNKAQKYD